MGVSDWRAVESAGGSDTKVETSIRIGTYSSGG